MQLLAYFVDGLLEMLRLFEAKPVVEDCDHINSVLLVGDFLETLLLLDRDFETWLLLYDDLETDQILIFVEINTELLTLVRADLLLSTESFCLFGLGPIDRSYTKCIGISCGKRRPFQVVSLTGRESRVR